MNNWMKQINWYEGELNKLKEENFELLKQAVTIKHENEELRNLLYVLTRHPHEMKAIRKKLFVQCSVDNSQSDTLTEVQ